MSTPISELDLHHMVKRVLLITSAKELGHDASLDSKEK